MIASRIFFCNFFPIWTLWHLWGWFQSKVSCSQNKKLPFGSSENSMFKKCHLLWESQCFCPRILIKLFRFNWIGRTNWCTSFWTVHFSQSDIMWWEPGNNGCLLEVCKLSEESYIVSWTKLRESCPRIKKMPGSKKYKCSHSGAIWLCVFRALNCLVYSRCLCQLINKHFWLWIWITEGIIIIASVYYVENLVF